MYLEIFMRGDEQDNHFHSVFFIKAVYINEYTVQKYEV